jgi:tRNA modification GTPase
MTSRQPILLLVSNKIDKVRTIDESYFTAFAADTFPQLLRYNVSCTTGDGVDDFLNALTSIVFQRVVGDDDSRRRKEGSGEEIEGIDDETSTVITRARHRYHVQKAIEALQRFEVRSQQGLISADLAAEELRLAASELGRIVGAIDVEDVLDVLFTDFCIGK